MRNKFGYLTTALLLAPGLMLAQRWEFGATAGGGIYTTATVTSPAGTGDVGLKPGVSFGAIIGNDMYRYVSGELRYEFGFGDFKVKSGGTEATFGAQTHSIHYDFLVHARHAEAKVRPFVVAGAGVRVYKGTGKEIAAQPLSRLALLTKTIDTKPLITFGGGVKARITERCSFRVEARDFVTPNPNNAIAPSIGAKISGWLHNFVVMAGVTYAF